MTTATKQKKEEKSNATKTLSISEHFYSVQGEGHSSGVPAYFIRLKGCNLMCGGRDGSLVKAGKATWWCDTEYVWRKGAKTSFDDIITSWQESDILDWVLSGRVHVVWTGGEPTLYKHQKDIVEFLTYLQSKFEDTIGRYRRPCFNEIETNGTQYIEDDLFEVTDQINCSVKLSNSGEPFEKRFCAIALRRIMSHPNYWFKFVISEEKDLEEIDEKFISPLKIPAERILMMPGLDSQKNYHERTLFCMEMAKKYGYTGLTRLHVSAWDRTTGV